MKTTLTLLQRTWLAIPALLLGAGLGYGQTIYNGSFELGMPLGDSVLLGAVNTTNIAGWTVSSGSIDYIGTRWQAGEGGRSVDLAGISAGTLQQSVSGFLPGNAYRLSFLMAGNTEGGPLIKGLTATVGATSQSFTFNDAGFSDANMGWSLRTMDFVANSPTMLVSFTSQQTSNWGPTLDAVSIVQVPEPSTLALVGGFALAGLFARQGRPRARAAK